MPNDNLQGVAKVCTPHLQQKRQKIWTSPFVSNWFYQFVIKINYEKFSGSKNILWRSSTKWYTFLAYFWAISCIFGPTKNFFETYFIILLHIQFQEAVFNQSVKSTSKNIEKRLRYRYFCKISLNQHRFGTVPIK